ncbi:hypothetical protein [Marispirochaeta sp.]|jgi:hypothetical protein|uniref:hypothetical protein n=1 Tax=Marispirochaeta sp. TaxID=2038653 RepID=UPI0029C718D7|nr:hypothetical protein [Marispirochaeta sp.]
MNPFIYLLIALAIATTLGYFKGRKKNRRIGGMIGEAAEKILTPEKKEYVNIGGTLGHNFTYTLDKPFTEAKGTFTLLPRHSVLYLPLSLLITRHDRFYLHLFSSRELQGEGHIIAKKYYPKMRVDIKGIDKLKRDTAQTREGEFILLWDNPHLEAKMRTLLEDTEGIDTLLHFCCYRDNRVFFIHSIPKEPQLEQLLKGIYQKLPEFIKK